MNTTRYLPLAVSLLLGAAGCGGGASSPAMSASSSSSAAVAQIDPFTSAVAAVVATASDSASPLASDGIAVTASDTDQPLFVY